MPTYSDEAIQHALMPVYQGVWADPIWTLYGSVPLDVVLAADAKGRKKPVPVEQNYASTYISEDHLGREKGSKLAAFAGDGRESSEW